MLSAVIVEKKIRAVVTIAPKFFAKAEAWPSHTSMLFSTKLNKGGKYV